MRSLILCTLFAMAGLVRWSEASTSGYSLGNTEVAVPVGLGKLWFALVDEQQLLSQSIDKMEAGNARHCLKKLAAYSEALPAWAAETPNYHRLGGQAKNLERIYEQLRQTLETGDWAKMQALALRADTVLQSIEELLPESALLEKTR